MTHISRMFTLDVLRSMLITLAIVLAIAGLPLGTRLAERLLEGYPPPKAFESFGRKLLSLLLDLWVLIPGYGLSLAVLAWVRKRLDVVVETTGVPALTAFRFGIAVAASVLILGQVGLQKMVSERPRAAIDWIDQGSWNILLPQGASSWRWLRVHGPPELTIGSGTISPPDTLPSWATDALPDQTSSAASLAPALILFALIAATVFWFRAARRQEFSIAALAGPIALFGLQKLGVSLALLFGVAWGWPPSAVEWVVTGALIGTLVLVLGCLGNRSSGRRAPRWNRWSNRVRAHRPKPALVVIPLVCVIMLPQLLSMHLPELPKSAWRGPPQGARSVSCQDFDGFLEGSDGIRARIQGRYIGVGHALTDKMLTIQRALIGHDVVVSSSGSDGPIYRFSRLQLGSQPWRWSGPAFRLTPDGEEHRLPQPQGTLLLDRRGAVIR